jgi:hypothetical protein
VVDEPFAQDERLLVIPCDVVVSGERYRWQRGSQLHRNTNSVNLSCDPTDLRFDKVNVAKLSHRVLLARADSLLCLHASVAELRLQTCVRARFAVSMAGLGLRCRCRTSLLCQTSECETHSHQANAT